MPLSHAARLIEDSVYNDSEMTTEELLGKAAYNGYLSTTCEEAPWWDELTEAAKEPWKKAARYIVGHSAEIKRA
jgi:hypothetical protein